ncbi:MAG: hypothetical protein RSA86_03380 [Christensenellaceae bacterium]
MEIIQVALHNLIGSIAFILGVMLLMIELFRHGLSVLSIIAYGCFVTSILFLANSVLYCVVAISGLSALFLVLLFYYKKEKKRRKKNNEEEE